MPKTVNGLFDKVTSLSNLYIAYLDAKDRKSLFPDILRYSSDLFENLINLRYQLINGIWCPGTYKEKIIFEPKVRHIHAPIFGDRVCHHAILNYTYWIFDRKMISTSFSCRVGKGKDACRECLKDYYRKQMNIISSKNFFFLKGDIRKFYDSIDHEVLLGIIERKIRDKKLLNLINVLVTKSGYEVAGIPIGAVTSQLFGNIYLDYFDHFIKDELGIRFYMRYADDFLIISEDRNKLVNLMNIAREFLHYNLKLDLSKKSYIGYAKNGIDFAGYREFGDYTLPRKRIIKRFKNTINSLERKYLIGLSDKKIQNIIFSYLGVFMHCDSYNSIMNILKDSSLFKKEG